MKNSETIVNIFMDKLREDMYEGNMHVCLRDLGRTIGGYISNKEISHSDASHLENYAVSLCKDKSVGASTWKKAVTYGSSQPLTFASKDYDQYIDDDDDLDMNAVLGPSMMTKKKKKGVVIDRGWIQKAEIPPCPEDWNPANDMINYIKALFKPDEYICYVLNAFQKEGSDKWLPKEGMYARTANEVCTLLAQHGSVEKALSSYNTESGAWIRVNPLDGQGVSQPNVTDYRHVLIESDECSLEEQYSILQELKLPISSLVHSGKKSLHALIRIDAGNDFELYKKRVDFLYDYCKRNCFLIDASNKNPSRLSRLPGIERDGRKQYKIGGKFGLSNWDEWMDHVQSLDDDLPAIECLEDDWENPPDLAPELINGMLRRGHKLLISGPSKAGKSWSLMQLAIAMAENGEWLGFKVQKGRSLYINLELDHRSCKHRFKTICEYKEFNNPNVKDMDIWNLRGKNKPLNELVPHLVRRAMRKRYDAIIIDPIYKVITGDENNASDMANFCNQFDKLSTALDCAVIYCHHHSKGTQGQKKSSDRSSGSGVFARDPDAILDLLPLQISDELEEEIVNKEIKDHLIKEVTIKYPDFKDYMTSEQSLTVLGVTEAVDTYLEGDTTLSTQLKFEARKKAEAITAWRIEATLREFPQFKPKDVFFKYPVHEEDKDDLLKDALVEGELPPKLTRKPKTEAKRREDQIAKELDREEKNFEKEQERKRRLAEKEQEQEKKLAEKEQETKVLLNKYNEAFEELENINEDLTITNLSNILGSNRSQVDRKLKNELSPYFECHKGGLVERRIF